jgi:hypothetical protein
MSAHTHIGCPLHSGRTTDATIAPGGRPAS